MIRVTMEFIPGGVGEPEHLGTIEISNQVFRTLNDPYRGDYEYSLWKKRSTQKPWVKGEIKNYPRLAYHPWNLIARILKDVAKNNGGQI